MGVPGEWTQIAIERRDTGEMIGDLGFRIDVDYPHEAELGYRIARGARSSCRAESATAAECRLKVGDGVTRKRQAR